MYSRDSYLDMFRELDTILTDGIKKDPNNKKMQRIIQLNNNMFIFTNQLFNKQDFTELENRLLYKQLHDTQVELETLKLNYDRQISKDSK